MVEFTDLKTAVRENLHDGDTAAFEGFTHSIRSGLVWFRRPLSSPSRRSRPASKRS